jgi:cold shock protein
MSPWARVGVVESFDDDAGIGTVRADDGQEFFLHCTSVADGTRTIKVGTAVSFEIAPGHLGLWQAVSVRPIDNE